MVWYIELKIGYEGFVIHLNYGRYYWVWASRTPRRIYHGREYLDFLKKEVAAMEEKYGVSTGA